LLELYLFKQTIEEDFEEDKHIIIFLSYALNPLNFDFILNFIGRCFENRDLVHVLKGVDATSP